MVTAKRDPDRVYAHFDAFAAMLPVAGKVIRWSAMHILAELAVVDGEHKWDGLLPNYVAFICADNLVSAVTAIRGAARVAAVRPDLLGTVVDAILDVEQARYETPECRNVAIGHALDTLAALGPMALARADVAEFIRRQRGNPRAAVAHRAERMIAATA